MDEQRIPNYEQETTLCLYRSPAGKNTCRTVRESFGCQVRLNLSQTILTMGIVNTNNIEETASVCRFAAEAAADGYEGYACALTLDELSPEPFIHDFSNRRFLDVPTILAEPGVYRAVLSSQAVNNILITAWQMFTAKRARSGATPLAGKENKRSFQTVLQCVIIRGGADSRTAYAYFHGKWTARVFQAVT